ncbi:MAG TPA: HAMP domain-containing sensor histidine kinase [Gaiellaceae bacterium]|nr:HAMP domain-containing sensor histidine kinase [Gaiellaceae bacterium]
MSIRLRATLATVVIAAVAVGGADAASFVLLHRYLDGRSKSSVRTVAETASAATATGATLSFDLFPGTDRPVLVEVRSPSGALLQRLGSPTDARLIPAGLTTRLNRPRSVSTGDGPPRYEAIAVADKRSHVVVAVISLSSEDETLRHLLVINLWVGVVVLAALAIAAAVILKRSLRPLSRIAVTADAIAAGNLAERVPPASPRTEIGRVSGAINRMLEEIESAFAQRDATEQRLRQFLADASHELRTPLTSIRGYAELFRRGADRDPADLAKAMAAIESEGERMSHLVEDLLLLARLDDAPPLEREPVDLTHVINDAVDAARVVDPSRSYGFELRSSDLVVEGDPRQLRQVLDNLLGNVRQHTPAGTAAYVTATRSGDDVHVVVEDDGPGVGAELRDRIFDRFFRPEGGRTRGTGGSGLGLAIVRSIVSGHGGSVEVRAGRPKGIVFELRLPAAQLSANSQSPLRVG